LTSTVRIFEARRGRERPIGVVPRAIVGALILAGATQVGLTARLPAVTTAPEALPEPPTAAYLQLAAVGEPVALGKLLMLWLQAFDYRGDSRVPYRALDYDKLGRWIERIVALDPSGQYALLSAARIYAEVPDPRKQRVMLDLVLRLFREDPNRRWPWLAHATVLAKHRLKDLPLALAYARELGERATGPEVPLWARQMAPFLLEDMNELEAARILIGGLLAAGQVRDARDAALLESRLKALEERIQSGR
jgi:hypothetical protein